MSLNNTQKISLHLQSTRSTPKRHISNLTLSPKQDDKKSKICILPNKFVILANNDIYDYSDTSTPSNSTKEDLTKSPYTDQNTGPPASTLYIKNIANFSTFNSTLKSIADPNGFTCKSSASHFTIQSSGRNRL